jgi:uncharacterized protein (DUF1501 family)
MITRRTMLVGGLGAAATTLLTAPSAAAASAGTTATRCILLYMHGGASQFETFDPKPGTREGGPTKAIATAIDGVQFSAHLPGLARRADALAVLRSVTMREGNHDRARYLMRTGHTPQGGVVHPGLAAMVDARHGDADFIGAVAIGAPTQSPGLLGPRHAALTVRKAMQGLRGLDDDPDVRDTKRAALFGALQDRFAEGRTRAPIDGHTETFGRARVVMRSPKRAAFDLSAESAATRARYGEDDFGTGCLLARRLVDHDVAFVEVGLNGWDTHEDNFARTTELAKQLDRGMSALLDDLVSSGRIADTLVVCMGDFGRTPSINGREGRDHFPDIASVVLAGGGISGGLAVGATSTDGREIAERPIAIADLYRTITTRLGIDPDEVRLAASGRPITTVDGGKVIDELV